MTGTVGLLVGYEWFFDGVWWYRPLCVLDGWFLVEGPMSLMTWRITADAAGPEVRRWARTRRVPWADVTRVVRTPDGELIVRRTADLKDRSPGSSPAPGGNGRAAARPPRRAPPRS